MVHVGDLERTDIVGAKKAGYYAIRFIGATPMDEDESTIADAVTANLIGFAAPHCSPVDQM